MIKLIEMKVSEIMVTYRPGSQDETWTWNDEYLYCWVEDGPKTNAISNRIKEEGIGFADKENPILLGNDGRVWDGHHRILLARFLEIETVMVEVVPNYYSRYDAKYQEEEKARRRQQSRNDWLTPIDLIIWEHTHFHNAIIFSGDDKPIKEKENAN